MEPRVEMIEHGDGSPQVEKVYSESLRQWGSVPNFFKMLANAPAALQSWQVMDEGIRLRHLKEDPQYVKIMEMVIIKTAAVNDGEYCLTHNVELGQSLGITDEQIRAILGDYKDSPLLSEREKTAIRWAELMTTLKVQDADEAFQELKRHFTEEQIVELSVYCGMWNYSNRLCQALHIPLEPAGKRISFQPELQ